MTLNVTVPPNTRAAIHLPGVGGQVLESGVPVARGRGLTMLKEGVFEAVSGTYEFIYPYRGRIEGR